MTHDSSLAASTHPYDSLTPDTILDAMEEAGFAVSGRLFALNSYENRVYQVGLEERAPVITKFYRPGRWSEAEIQEEHDFTLELLQADIPVVAPMKLTSGDTLGRHGEFLFAVFPQRGGQAPDTSVTDTLYRLGQWLGQIHNIGARNHLPIALAWICLRALKPATGFWLKATGFRGSQARLGQSDPRPAKALCGAG